jgi:hypothetical protein
MAAQASKLITQHTPPRGTNRLPQPPRAPLALPPREAITRDTESHENNFPEGV